MTNCSHRIEIETGTLKVRLIPSGLFVVGGQNKINTVRSPLFSTCACDKRSSGVVEDFGGKLYAPIRTICCNDREMTGEFSAKSRSPESYKAVSFVGSVRLKVFGFFLFENVFIMRTQSFETCTNTLNENARISVDELNAVETKSSMTLRRKFLFKSGIMSITVVLHVKYTYSGT